MFEAFEMLRRGGDWLGRARAWMQNHKHNGSRVTWGSQEELVPPVTVREVEEIAAYSAAAALKESDAGKDLATLGELLDAGLLVQKETLTGEESWKVRFFLGRLERYRTPKAEAKAK